VAVVASARRSLLGHALTAAAAARPAWRPRLSALAAKAREHVVTAAALTLVDLGAWHGGQIWGFVVTGCSLLVLDFAVRG